MILSKTYKQKYQENQRYLESIKDGYEWFAWYPVIENYGRIVWLQKVKVDRGVIRGKNEFRQISNYKIYHLI